jgi:FixJ family two-component response regulator
LPGIVHVVDDDPLFLIAIQLLLEAVGHRVITYASAQQLLDQRPDETSPGCILLGVRMPGLSGPKLQSRLTEFGSTLPIVFLTGYMDVAATVNALKVGAHSATRDSTSVERRTGSASSPAIDPDPAPAGGLRDDRAG